MLYMFSMIVQHVQSVQILFDLLRIKQVIYVLFQSFKVASVSAIVDVIACVRIWCKYVECDTVLKVCKSNIIGVSGFRSGIFRLAGIFLIDPFRYTHSFGLINLNSFWNFLKILILIYVRAYYQSPGILLRRPIAKT